MANKRELKKEINFLTDELLAECICNGLCEDTANAGKSEELMTRIIDMRNNLIARVNHPDGKNNPKKTKEHYKKIIADLDKAIDEIFGELGEETEK